MIFVLLKTESPDLNPIEMVRNQLKRSIAKSEPRTKEELIDAITSFWYSTMTVELCNKYIDHVYKAAPVCIAMNGKATGDIPNIVFDVRSEGRSLSYFSELLKTDKCKNKLRQLNVRDEVQ